MRASEENERQQPEKGKKVQRCCFLFFSSNDPRPRRLQLTEVSLGKRPCDALLDLGWVALASSHKDLTA